MNSVTTNPIIEFQDSYFLISDKTFYYKEIKKVEVLKGKNNWWSFLLNLFWIIILLDYKLFGNLSTESHIIITYKDSSIKNVKWLIKIDYKEIKELQLLFDKFMLQQQLV